MFILALHSIGRSDSNGYVYHLNNASQSMVSLLDLIKCLEREGLDPLIKPLGNISALLFCVDGIGLDTLFILLSLFIFVSLSPSLSLSLCLPLYLCLSVSLFISVSLSPSLSLSVCHRVYQLTSPLSLSPTQMVFIAIIRRSSQHPASHMFRLSIINSN